MVVQKDTDRQQCNTTVNCASVVCASCSQWSQASSPSLLPVHVSRARHTDHSHVQHMITHVHSSRWRLVSVKVDSQVIFVLTLDVKQSILSLLGLLAKARSKVDGNL